VNVAATTTVLPRRGTLAVPTRPWTLFAEVSTGYERRPTGEVIFKDGTTTIATVALDRVEQCIRRSSEEACTRSTAAYTGDANDHWPACRTAKQYIRVFSRQIRDSREFVAVAFVFPGDRLTFTADRRADRSGIRRISDGELVTFYDGKTTLGFGGAFGRNCSVTTVLAKRLNTTSSKQTLPGDTTFKPSHGTVKQVR